jgi:tRNA (guanine-N7-)-methyltransferase
LNRSRFQLYGRRKAKALRPRQQRLMDSLLPGLRILLPGPRTLRPLSLFRHPVSEVWLEIGFGGGEHLASLAARHPQTGLIGAEPFRNGIAKLLVAIEADCLANIRIFDGDGRTLLEGLENAAIDRLFILYPDPWPKRRHEKRRLLDAWTIAELHRVMKPGAELHLASDSADYIGWSLRNILAHGGFDWSAEKADDWRRSPAGWCQTRYEAKALEEGRLPFYLGFSRLP